MHESGGKLTNTDNLPEQLNNAGTQLTVLLTPLLPFALPQAVTALEFPEETLLQVPQHCQCSLKIQEQPKDTWWAKKYPPKPGTLLRVPYTLSISL